MRVYLGDVGTTQAQKTLMPMTGGFLATENFAAASRRGRLASGKLVVDVVATKRRFTFSFEKIMAVDFEVWDAQYRSNAFREVEIENRDGTFTKVTVEFGSDYVAQRFRTRDEWLYAGVQFVLEEV